ncbi:cyclic nucleotide-binding and patatin-like phospholipase domain-containing protein [Nannocystis sp.]|uniref:patatin-like phospholipase family protein n=1 Tax=Nannocystis sp. TaxID=1962667 RepID=UPI002421A58C|nr:cyclic nucleotide-binding and patatin-like phospholipase domain-containing protein [Nannocystis sp.]MBK7826764.1 patatin-like phospholipase family protein [Nannocystis sp.]MBK9754385.1 patatin-like phospholipase family protein [Nannocystis sp.]
MVYPALRPSTVAPSTEDIDRSIAGCALLDGLPPAAVAAFLARVEWCYVPGQTTIARKGDACTHLLWVVAGRLRLWGEVLRETGRRAVVEDAGVGEVLGDVELQGSGRHSGDVEAMRDSEVGAIAVGAFLQCAAEHPLLWRNLARSLLRYVPGAQAPAFAPKSENFVVVAAGDDVPLAEFAEQLRAAIGRRDPVTWLPMSEVDAQCGQGVLGDDIDAWTETDRGFARWLGAQERSHRFVFLEAERGGSSWTARAVRNADHVLVVARAGGDPRPGPAEQAAIAAMAASGRSVMLVLLEADDTQEPAGTREWLAYRPTLESVFHVRSSELAHVERLARHLTGRAIGLVLGGGGARGSAHIGVVKALRELGVPIDLSGGTSAGGGVACMVAAGRDPARMARDSDHAFVTLAPFQAFDIPYGSLLQRDAVDRPAKWLFGDTDIEDLWLPWFAVSCDLVTGKMVVHRRGRAWKAVRATTSLPAVLPPIHIRGKVLVDGGVVNNTPVAVMRQLSRGPCILVDVGGADEQMVGDDVLDLPTNLDMVVAGLHPLLSRRKTPNLGAVVAQTMCVSGMGEENRRGADVYIAPAVAGYGVVDFAALTELVALGYNATMEAFERRADDPEFLARFGLTSLSTPLPRMEVPLWEGETRRRRAERAGRVRISVALALLGALVGTALPSVVFQVPVIEGLGVGVIAGLIPWLHAWLGDARERSA